MVLVDIQHIVPHLQDIKEILVVLVVVLTPNLHPINQPCHLYRKGAVVFLVKEIQVAEIFHSPPGYCQVGGGGGGAGGPGTRGFTDTNNYPTSNYFYGGTGGAGTQVSEFPFTEIFSGVIPESDFPSDTLERSENGYFAGGGGGGASPPPGNHYRGQGGIGGVEWICKCVPVPRPPVYVPYPGNPTSTNYAQDGAARLGGGGVWKKFVPSYRGGRGGSQSV